MEEHQHQFQTLHSAATLVLADQQINVLTNELNGNFDGECEDEKSP